MQHGEMRFNEGCRNQGNVHEVGSGIGVSGQEFTLDGEKLA